jgi:hypothetical protein
LALILNCRKTLINKKKGVFFDGAKLVV